MGGASGNILEDKNYLRFSLNGLIQSIDIRMVQPLHESNLSPDSLLSLYVLYLLFLVDF